VIAPDAAHAFEPGLSLAGRGLRIPGPRAELRAAEQQECFPFQSCPTCPVVSVHRAGSAVSRLTFAADAGGQPGLVLSVVAGIAPVLMDQMGVGAPSRPARRRPELAARAAVRAQRQARRSARGGALVQPGQVPGCRGRRAAAGAAGLGRDRPAGTGRVAAGLLADGLTFCLAAGIGRATLADYLQ
jgi:hypothetical protein